MKKKSRFLFAAIVIALYFFTSGCDSTGKKSPSEVLVAAYMAANEGNYSEADKYLSSEAINLLKEMGAGSMIDEWDEVTYSGTIKRIAILEEEIQEERATVYFRAYLNDGTTEDEEEIFIKEDNQWKITIDYDLPKQQNFIEHGKELFEK